MLAICCYKCFASKTDIQDCSATASWRSRRKTTFDHFQQCNEKGLNISALFSCPGMDLDAFQIDWLHAVDLGVAADFMGNLMYYILPKFPGTNQQERCSAMFRNIQAYYRTTSPGNRLDNLTPLMLRKVSKKTSKMGSPKLRASAGEARALAPWTLQIATTFLDPDDVLEGTILAATKSLNKCYSFLSRESFDQDQLADHSRQFCVLYAAISKFFDESNECLWVFKPKFHLFQELCEFQHGNPSLHWTYRDEDFGGSIAHMAKRRGGANTILSLSRDVLVKFMAQHLVPEWPSR